MSRATVRAFSRRTLTPGVRVRFQVSPCEISGGPSGPGTGFFQVLRSSRVTIIPPVLDTSEYSSRQKDKRAKPGNFPESNALPEIEEHYIEKHLYFFSILLG